MDNYFRSIKTTAQIMMRETAGIQLSIDYDSEEDAMQKLRTATFLSPIVSAMFANSPIRNGKLSNYRSYRTNSWLCVDEHRWCLIDSLLFIRNWTFLLKIIAICY
jgi:glutamate--cysteine ligase